MPTQRSQITTEELCRHFEQRLAAIRPLQAALHDKVLTAEPEKYRKACQEAEVRLALAASQIHNAAVELRRHINKRGHGVMRESQFDRDIRRWQAAQDPRRITARTSAGSGSSSG